MEDMERLLMQLEADVMQSTLLTVGKALEAVVGMADDMSSGLGHVIAAISDIDNIGISDDTLQHGRDAINNWQQAKPQLDMIVEEVKREHGT